MAVSLEEDEDSGVGREAQFKSRMSRMIAKQKEVIARARDPGLNPDERRKASHDVVLNMMGQTTFHDIDSALAEADKMSPEDAAETRKAAMEAIAGNVRMMLCMTRGSVFTTEDCEEYLARLPDVYKREVIRSFKEHRPLDRRHLVTRRCNYPPASVR
jgi:hypothetical protein